MGLVKYTRYPEERGRGIKTMQQGVDYSGVVQLEWPDFPVFQRQVAGFLSTTLSDHKLKADHHILNPNWLPANPLQSMGVLRCFSQKHNFKWFIAVREKTGKENEKNACSCFTSPPELAKHCYFRGKWGDVWQCRESTAACTTLFFNRRAPDIWSQLQSTLSQALPHLLASQVSSATYSFKNFRT